MGHERPTRLWRRRVLDARSSTHEAGHVLAGHLWLGALPRVCTVVRSPERRAGCDWGDTLNIWTPAPDKWGRIPDVAEPQLVNRLRLFVGGAVATRIFGREPGIWWRDDRGRAFEYAKWLEGRDEGRQRRRVSDTMREVSTTFADPTHMPILTALATALLTEKTLVAERLAEVIEGAEMGTPIR
jgi:hypothetical protein